MLAFIVCTYVFEISIKYMFVYILVSGYIVIMDLMVIHKYLISCRAGLLLRILVITKTVSYFFLNNTEVDNFLEY